METIKSILENLPSGNKDKFSNKDSDIICWYPSSGSDIEAVDYWQKNIDINLKPNIFILTDLAYQFEIGTRNFYTNADDKKINIPYKFKIIKHFNKISIGDNLNFIEEDNAFLQYKERMLNQFINDIDTQIVIEKLLKNKDEKVIKSFPLIRKYFSTAEALESILNRKIHSFELLDLIEEKPALKKAWDIELLKLNDIFHQKAIISGCVLNSENKTIILLKCRNEDFYHYCLNNNISVNNFMLKHPADNIFIAGDYSAYLKELGIQEGIVSEGFLPTDKQIKKIATDINWASIYGEQRLFLVKF